MCRLVNAVSEWVVVSGGVREGQVRGTHGRHPSTEVTTNGLAGCRLGLGDSDQQGGGLSQAHTTHRLGRRNQGNRQQATGSSLDSQTGRRWSVLHKARSLSCEAWSQESRVVSRHDAGEREARIHAGMWNLIKFKDAKVGMSKAAPQAARRSRHVKNATSVVEAKYVGTSIHAHSIHASRSSV